MLLNFFDNLESEKKFALYRWDHQQDTTSDLKQKILGKRTASTDDLD